MILGKPAPFVSVFVDVVDEAMRGYHPSHGLSTMQGYTQDFYKNYRYLVG